MAERIAPDVMRVLDASTVELNALILPPGQLDRNLYERVNKVLELCGGKWNRKCKAHVFQVPAADALDRVMTAGEVTDVGKDLQQFFTPPDLAARLVDLAAVRLGHRCLEPSAGEGAIVRALLNVGARVEGYEIEPGTFARLLASFPPSIAAMASGDFLAFDPAPIFDRVVMNPPFSRQQDAQHILRALEWLKPTGRLVAVASAGVAYRETGLARLLREAVRRSGGSIIDLPEKSFRSAGTGVSTVVVTIDQPKYAHPAPAPATPEGGPSRG